MATPHRVVCGVSRIPCRNFLSPSGPRRPIAEPRQITHGQGVLVTPDGLPSRRQETETGPIAPKRSRVVGRPSQPVAHGSHRSRWLSKPRWTAICVEIRRRRRGSLVRRLGSVVVEGVVGRVAQNGQLARGFWDRHRHGGRGHALLRHPSGGASRRQRRRRCPPARGARQAQRADWP